MSRRTAERHARRMEIRFWRRGQEKAHSGFTIDLSKTGMFLGTTLSLEPGERLRLEIVDRERGFLVEGQVARVHRVSLALRHVEQPGVGVRFMGPGELVGALLQSGRKTGAGGAQDKRSEAPRSAAPPARTQPSAEREPEEPSRPAPPAPRMPPARATAPPRGESLEDLFGPDPEPPAKPPEAETGEAPAAAAEPRGAAPESPKTAAPPTARTVPVEFADRESFLSVYGRDIEAGGLFVTTDTPALLHEIVVVDLRPPIRSDIKLCFEARVVHRFDPQSGGAKPGLTGMGVQFLDPDRVRAALDPIVSELRG